MINLTKGQRISLTKENGEKLKHICLGANWSAITKKGFFGTKTQSVDLDLSVGAYDQQGNLLQGGSMRGVDFVQQLF